MITLYLFILINGQIVEYPTTKFDQSQNRVCLESARKNMKINPNIIWICK